MAWKFSDFCYVGFVCCFSFVMAYHFASVKTYGPDRGIASTEYKVQPWYDASFKY